MYIIETAATEPHETGLYFVGETEELGALHRQLIPVALGAVAAELITADEAARITRFATFDTRVETVPNHVKKAVVTMLDHRDAALNEREVSVVTSAAVGMLTTAQIVQEAKLLAELRVWDLTPIWLTSQGLLACPHNEGHLDVLAHDRQSEAWGTLETAQLAIADTLGATHLLTQYELEYEPFDEDTTIPRVLSNEEHFVFAARDDQGFTLLASVIGPDHLGFSVP